MRNQMRGTRALVELITPASCRMAAVSVMLLAALMCGYGQDKNVLIRVTAPASTPAGSKIFIAGNSPSLGNWDPGVVPLTKENDSTWVYSTAVPAGAVLEFKLTRGSWMSEAEYVDGVVPPNTIVTVSADTIVRLSPITWHDLTQTRQVRNSAGGVTGTVRYHRRLSGEGLRYSRDIVVWLPPSYLNEPAKRYPVLYMHDGQNVFNPATSFTGFDWRADEITDSLIRAEAIQEIIIVGIANTPDRLKEYGDTPLGRKYAKFVVERVKPYVDSHYRTKASRENTAVMGSSMGGLISMMFLLWYPSVFSQAACLSSSVGFGIGEKELEEHFIENQLSKNLRLYLDVGGLEKSLIPGNEALAAFLQKNGFQAGKNFEFIVAKGAVHNEQAWAQRLWRPLVFMFGR